MRGLFKDLASTKVAQGALKFGFRLNFWFGVLSEMCWFKVFVCFCRCVFFFVFQVIPYFCWLLVF